MPGSKFLQIFSALKNTIRIPFDAPKNPRDHQQTKTTLTHVVGFSIDVPMVKVHGTVLKM